MQHLLYNTECLVMITYKHVCIELNYNFAPRKIITSIILKWLHFTLVTPVQTAYVKIPITKEGMEQF